MDLVDYIVDPFRFEFMVRAFAMGAVASIVCAMLSCWLVLISWSLMGDAISHSVVPGVVLAYIVGLPFSIGAAVFGFLAASLIVVIRTNSRIKSDTAIGIVFTALFALGLVLVSVTPSDVDLNHIVFGNLLGVSRADLWQVMVAGLVVFSYLVVKRRDLMLYAFDPTHMQAIGLSPRLSGLALMTMLTLTTVIALQVVGVVLVVGMLVTPGATAYMLCDRFDRMLIVAPAVAVAATTLGLYVSYHGDLSPGGAIVLVQACAFFVTFLIAPRHGILARHGIVGPHRSSRL